MVTPQSLIVIRLHLSAWLGSKIAVTGMPIVSSSSEQSALSEIKSTFTVEEAEHVPKSWASSETVAQIATMGICRTQKAAHL
jgi:hypothetical protein